MSDEDGYRSRVTPGGTCGCIATLPFAFFGLAFLEDALHAVMRLGDWTAFYIPLLIAAIATFNAVKWAVNRLLGA